MKRLSLLLATGIVACAAVTLAGQPQAPGAGTGQANAAAAGGTIAGHIIEQGTGRPVKRASVSLRRVTTTATSVVPAVQNAPADPGAAGTAAARGNNLGGIVGTSAAGQNRGGGGQNIQDLLQNRGGRGGFGGGNTNVQTANDGTFIVTDVAPGDYTIIVTLDQYLTQEYGQRTLSGKGTPVNIQAGQRLDGIDFQMIRAGVIIGTILDEDGLPMPGIQVQALTYDYRNGQRIFKTVGSARTTDDSGGYRLYFLEPGDYYVSARPNAGAGGFNGLTGLGGGAQGLQGIQGLIQGLTGGQGFGGGGQGFGGGGQGFGGGGQGFGGGGQGFGGGGQGAPGAGGAPAGGGRGGAGGAAPAGGGGRGAGGPALQQGGRRAGGNQNFQDFIQNRGGATGNQNGGAAAQDPATPQEAYAPAFYPGTIDPAQAAAIHLAPGAEVRNIDFNIRPVPLVTLSGAVLQAVGLTAPATPPAATPNPQGRGGQTAAPTGRGATGGARGATPGTPAPQAGGGAAAPQTTPNAQNPAGGANNLQSLLSAARGGGNIQDLIAGLRDQINSSGGIAALLNGAGNGRANVSLVPIGSAGRGGWQSAGGRASVGEDGAFQITGVTPGAYNLVASSRSDAGTVTAMQRVDVGFGGNMTGLTLQLRANIAVPGQIYVDGATPENFRTQSLRFQLQPVDDIPNTGNATAQVSEDGSFRIENAVLGAQYRISMNNIQGGGYLQAGRYGGANALNAPFVIADEGTPLQLQIGFAPGRVETVVMDGDKAVPGALTALIPNDRGRFDLYRTANSDKEGKVAFANVPPGDYKLFAWEEIQQGAWQDPVAMEKFEDRGHPVHVEKAGASTEDIHIVRSETRF